MTLQQLLHVLITIRDRVITDQNLTTVKQVVDSMTELFAELANISIDESTLKEEFVSRGVSEQFLFFQKILNHPYLLKLKTQTTQITIERIIDALQFLKQHIKTSENMVDAVQELLTSLEQIVEYTTQDTASREVINPSSLSSELYTLYCDFIHE